MADRKIAIPPVRRLAVWGIGAVVVLGALALLLAWSGIYNVAATKPHFAVTRWFLELAMSGSVRTHAMGIEALDLDDPQLVRSGAGHFDLVCASCHGSPASPRAPVGEAMRPAPPPLGEAAGKWSDAELFWIIRHGLKYTGMPSWIAPERADEVWGVAAFVRQLSGMDAETYLRLTRGNLSDEAVRRRAADGRPFDLGVDGPQTSCARCHGTSEAAPVSAFIPAIAGQRAAYLKRTMDDFALGRRASGIMQPIAVALSADQRAEISDDYAALDAVARNAEIGHEAGSGDRMAAQIERGRRIATEGVAGAGIPPCLSCHGARSDTSFPVLAGQSGAYITRQIELWREGLRQRSTYGAIMAPIARRLSPSQASDVAAYFEQASKDGHGRETAARDGQRDDD